MMTSLIWNQPGFLFVVVGEFPDIVVPGVLHGVIVRLPIVIAFGVSFCLSADPQFIGNRF
jgi:hypothetical protein